MKRFYFYKLLIVLIFYFNNPIIIHSQVRKITGRVFNEQTQKPVLNAKVYIENSLTSVHTNSLGYFQLEISHNTKYLWIEHVAFRKSRVDIPEESRFAVILKPLVSVLPRLEIERVKDILELERLELSQSERRAYGSVFYKTGWKDFYNQFENYIVSDSLFNRKPFDAVIEFAIGPKANLIDVEVMPRGIQESEMLKSALLKMDSWVPAVQNNMPTYQRLSFPVSYGNINSEPVYLEEIGLTHASLEEFSKGVISSLNFPKHLAEENISATIIAEFVIQVNGDITNVKCDSKYKDFNQNIENAIRSFGGWYFKRYEFLTEPITTYLPFHLIYVGERDIQEFLGNLPEQFKEGLLLTYGYSKNLKMHKFRNATPRFPGGYNALQSFIKNNRKDFMDSIPPNRTEGNVIAVITISDKGEILNKKVISGLNKKLDEEALRIISKMPNWTFSEGKIPNKTKVKISIPFYEINNVKRKNADYLHYKAVNNFKRKNIKKAIKLVSRAIDKYPIEADYYFDRALMYFEVQNIDNGCGDLYKIKNYDQEALSIYNDYCEKVE